MEVILLILLLASGANAQIVGPSSNASDGSKVSKSGDTMTGPLTLSGSSLTVTGNAFSVGTSTLSVSNGRVGIRNPSALTSVLDIYSQDYALGPTLSMKLSNAPTYAWQWLVDETSTGDLFMQKKVAGADSNVMVYTRAGAVNVSGSSFSVGTSTFSVSNGRVGIGTNNPATMFQVLGGTTTISNYAAAATNYSMFNVRNGIASVDGAVMSIQGPNSGASKIHFTDATNYNYTIGTVAGTVGDFTFNSGGGGGAAGTERMRITQGGNVGIGTTGPQTKLHISSGTLTMDGTGSPTAGYALCFQANKQMGKCTTAVAADGTCTCGAP